MLSYNENSLTEQRKSCIYHASIGHLHSQSYYGDYSVTWDSFEQPDAFMLLNGKADALLGMQTPLGRAITPLKPIVIKRGQSPGLEREGWEPRGSPWSAKDTPCFPMYVLLSA